MKHNFAQLWLLLTALLLICSTPGVAQTAAGSATELGYGNDGFDQGSFEASEIPEDPSSPPHEAGARGRGPTPLSHAFYAGISFTARDSDQLHDYGSAGCIQGQVNGSGLWSVPLLLRHGALIQELKLYFYDDNVSAATTAWITRFNGGGSTQDLASAVSTDSGGYGTATVPVDHVVDRTNWSYVLYLRPGTNDNTVRGCGVRVGYH